MLKATRGSLVRCLPLLAGMRTAAATVVTSALLSGVTDGLADQTPSGQNQETWTCSYIAATPRGLLQITAKFQIVGDELAEIETIPSSLNFSERYKILENT